MKTSFAAPRLYTGPGKVQHSSGEFTCLHCGTRVLADAPMSGVRNRNHCPCCLSSRHLDHFEPGDRLSACKARMRPVGLTFKRVSKKHAGQNQGELMLVHLCESCGKISINRIAADDDERKILCVLESEVDLDQTTRDRLAQCEVTLLGTNQAPLVRRCLSGSA